MIRISCASYYTSFWPYIRLGVYKLLRDHPGDIYISVHPLINIPFLRAMRRREVYNALYDRGHRPGFHPYRLVCEEADLISIPTEQARTPADHSGIDPRI